jgi:hypothetical protein
LIFDDFRRFSFRKIVLYMGIEPGWCRIRPGYILKYFWSREQPQKHHFESQNLRFLIFRTPLENVDFDFLSQTDFLSHKSLNPRCTKCSYGP